MLVLVKVFSINVTSKSWVKVGFPSLVYYWCFIAQIWENSSIDYKHQPLFKQNILYETSSAKYIHQGASFPYDALGYASFFPLGGKDTKETSRNDKK